VSTPEQTQFAEEVRKAAEDNVGEALCNGSWMLLLPDGSEYDLDWRSGRVTKENEETGKRTVVQLDVRVVVVSVTEEDL
jgi:hypothetical protein